MSAVGGWRSTASMRYVRAMPQPACLRAVAWERGQGGWPPHPRPLSPVSRGRGEESAFSGEASRGRESAGVSAAGVRRQPCCTPGHCLNRLAFPVARVCVLWQICHGPFSDAKGFRLFCWRSGACLESQRGGQKIAAAWAFQKLRTQWECGVSSHIRSSKNVCFLGQISGWKARATFGGLRLGRCRGQRSGRAVRRHIQSSNKRVF